MCSSCADSAEDVSGLSNGSKEAGVEKGVKERSYVRVSREEEGDVEEVPTNIDGLLPYITLRVINSFNPDVDSFFS